MAQLFKEQGWGQTYVGGMKDWVEGGPCCTGSIQRLITAFPVSCIWENPTPQAEISNIVYCTDKEDESPERASCLPDDTQLAKQRNGYQVEIPAWAPKLPFLVLAQVVGIIIRAKRVGWSEFKSFPVVCQPCEFMSLP